MMRYPFGYKLNDTSALLDEWSLLIIRGGISYEEGCFFFLTKRLVLEKLILQDENNEVSDLCLNA
jgi:hypothetical protein